SHSTLVERSVYRDKHDQCEIGDSRSEARVSRSTEIPQMPNSGGRFLRVAEDGENEAALLLRGQRRRVVRIRRIVGWLEGRKREMGKDVLDSDHDSQLSDLPSPRPNASHPRPRQL